MSDPRSKEHGEMTPIREQGTKQLRNAGIAGCISTGITFLGCLISATGNESLDFSLWATAFISLILTIWIFKGSRLAATWMFVSFLINKLAALWIFKPSLFDVMTLVFLYFYFQGARAAFALHKEKTQEPSPPPLPTTNKTPWFAAVSLATVIVLTLSLPIKLVSSYFDTRPSKYPLHFAVAKGDLVTIDKLLQEGHDINFGGPLGTPLTVAAAAGRPAVIQHLIDRGSDPNLQDWKGWRPLHCAILPDRANLAAVTTLVRNGADVNGKDKHLRTPLHRAAQFGHADAVRLLLSLGAQPDAVDENGWTPFDRAEKHPEIQATLQEEMERQK